MKILSLYNRHDGGFAILEDGEIKMHTEFERYNRLKESGGDSLSLFTSIFHEDGLKNIDAFVSVMPNNGLENANGETYKTHDTIPKEKIHFYGHHLSHAAHAYYSSPFNNAIAISVDNAGMDENNRPVSLAIYFCRGNKMEKIFDVLSPNFSLGDIWGRMTRFVFKLWSGYPRGHQAGSVMAMAALGDPNKYYNDVVEIFGRNHDKAVAAPPNMKRGVYVPPEEEVEHPYLNKYRLIAEDEKEKFNLAASLQKVTEEFLADIVTKAMKAAKEQGFITNNVVFSGGCSLNSVAMGKIASQLKSIDWNCYIPPVPYDGGLNIGAAQYHYHHILNNPKFYNKEKWVSPYLGEVYDKQLIEKTIDFKGLKSKKDVSKEHVAQLIADGQIVSIFNGPSESGRRALGNRSILANPGIANMKAMINDKVKHRQWYRPFAPSVLSDFGEEWFQDYFFSPYMGFVFQIKTEKRGKAPGIEHFDGTARIQSVSKELNPDYYEIIDEFRKLTGIPMVLNTSFNDREPIVETPAHAVDCFLGTDIDYLYFVKEGILVENDE